MELGPNTASLKLLLEVEVALGVFEASQSHCRLGNLDVALRANLFAVLTKSAALFWHDGFASLLLG